MESRLNDFFICVATQKKLDINVPEVYHPIFVGKDLKPDSDSYEYLCDNTGENISFLNPLACELTALFWMWKNVDCKYYGLCHYRRFFKGRNGLLTEREMILLLDNKDIILPRKNNYFIESLYDHYSHTHYREHLDKTREIILKDYPEYLPFFDLHMKEKKSHMYNMFVMRKNVFDEYMSWLMDILFSLEKVVDCTDYSPFQKRYLGRISELLLDIWISKNGYKYSECKVLSLGGNNFFKKVFRFLKSYFTKKRYDKSA